MVNFKNICNLLYSKLKIFIIDPLYSKIKTFIINWILKEYKFTFTVATALFTGIIATFSICTYFNLKEDIRLKNRPYVFVASVKYDRSKEPPDGICVDTTKNKNIIIVKGRFRIDNKGTVPACEIIIRSEIDTNNSADLEYLQFDDWKSDLKYWLPPGGYIHVPLFHPKENETSTNILPQKSLHIFIWYKGIFDEKYRYHTVYKINNRGIEPVNTTSD